MADARALKYPDEILFLSMFYPSIYLRSLAERFVLQFNKGPGTYIVRPNTDNDPKFVSISVSIEGPAVHHVKIHIEKQQRTFSYYIIENVKFSTFNELLSHYSVHRIHCAQKINNLKLLTPLEKQKQKGALGKVSPSNKEMHIIKSQSLDMAIKSSPCSANYIAGIKAQPNRMPPPTPHLMKLPRSMSHTEGLKLNNHQIVLSPKDNQNNTRSNIYVNTSITKHNPITQRPPMPLPPSDTDPSDDIYYSTPDNPLVLEKQDCLHNVQSPKLVGPQDCLQNAQNSKYVGSQDCLQNAQSPKLAGPQDCLRNVQSPKHVGPTLSLGWTVHFSKDSSRPRSVIFQKEDVTTQEIPAELVGKLSPSQVQFIASLYCENHQQLPQFFQKLLEKISEVNVPSEASVVASVQSSCTSLQASSIENLNSLDRTANERKHFQSPLPTSSELQSLVPVKKSVNNQVHSHIENDDDTYNYEKPESLFVFNVSKTDESQQHTKSEENKNSTVIKTATEIQKPTICVPKPLPRRRLIKPNIVPKIDPHSKLGMSDNAHYEISDPKLPTNIGKNISKSDPYILDEANYETSDSMLATKIGKNISKSDAYTLDEANYETPDPVLRTNVVKNNSKSDPYVLDEANYETPNPVLRTNVGKNNSKSDPYVLDEANYETPDPVLKTNVGKNNSKSDPYVLDEANYETPDPVLRTYVGKNNSKSNPYILNKVNYEFPSSTLSKNIGKNSSILATKTSKSKIETNSVYVFSDDKPTNGESMYQNVSPSNDETSQRNSNPEGSVYENSDILLANKNNKVSVGVISTNSGVTSQTTIKNKNSDLYVNVDVGNNSI